jgi:hypothetical protein
MIRIHRRNRRSTGNVIPSVSAIAVIVDAVPIVMQ